MNANGVIPLPGDRQRGTCGCSHVHPPGAVFCFACDRPLATSGATAEPQAAPEPAPDEPQPPDPIREIGRLTDVEGNVLVVGVDGALVTIGGGTDDWALDASQRELFARYYFDAERHVEAWVRAAREVT